MQRVHVPKETKKKDIQLVQQQQLWSFTPPAMDSNFHECGGGGAKYSTETFPEHFG